MHFDLGPKVSYHMYDVTSHTELIENSFLRTHSIRDIVSKITFPHGLHNTVEELVAASNFPSDAREWPTAIGQAPSNVEIDQSRKLFEKEKYPNMYR